MTRRNEKPGGTKPRFGVTTDWSDRVRAMEFWKGHGLGNDYLVVDATPPATMPDAQTVRRLCDRHRGPGADGVLVPDVSGRPFRLRIFNPDGSEAEKSGNGLRIFCAWLHGRGLVADGERFAVALQKDTVELRVVERLAEGALQIEVDMGPASFRAEDAGFRASGEVLGRPLDVNGEPVAIHVVSLGNPHCVVYADRLERDAFLRLGPALCTHPAFPAGTNVQFARVRARTRVEAWIWERGAGETLASGSSACAVAAVGVRTGRLDPGPITVAMPGGEVLVEVAEDYRLRLTGPAVIVIRGEVLHLG